MYWITFLCKTLSWLLKKTTINQNVLDILWFHTYRDQIQIMYDALPWSYKTQLLLIDLFSTRKASTIIMSRLSLSIIARERKNIKIESWERGKDRMGEIETKNGDRREIKILGPPRRKIIVPYFHLFCRSPLMLRYASVSPKYSSTPPPLNSYTWLWLVVGRSYKLLFGSNESVLDLWRQKCTFIIISVERNICIGQNCEMNNLFLFFISYYSSKIFLVTNFLF